MIAAALAKNRRASEASPCAKQSPSAKLPAPPPSCLAHRWD
jgi:hypothetical protein